MLTSTQKDFRKKLIAMKAAIVVIFFIVLCTGIVKVVAQSADLNTLSVKNETEQTKNTDPGVIQFAFLASAIAVGVGSLGAGIAVGYVGSAAMGTIGEKPELAGRALIFIGLAEGIAIYGLIIAIMILGKI